MDDLLDFGAREDVRAVVLAYLERPDAVQGIAVDLDDFWLASWQRYVTLPPRDFALAQDRAVDAWRHFGWWRWPDVPPLDFGRSAPDGFVGYPFGIDVSWRPPRWGDYVGVRDLRDEPYSLKVILRPEVPRASVASLHEIDTNGFQVHFEPRPVATLYAKSTDAVRPLVGGLSISSASGLPGTLGGILLDASGRRLGLTCAHVLAKGDDARQPSPSDNAGAASHIGTCIAANSLATHVPPLDPYGDPSINEVDAAVVEPDQPADLSILGIGGITAVAPKSRVNTGGSVEVAGKSGRRTLYVGAAVLTRELQLNGTTYGYKNLFELRRQSRFWGVTGTLGPPVEPGDSGGWVLRAGAHGPEWLGVVIGGDGPVGYAIPAEFVTDWLAGPAGIGSVSVY